MTKKEEEKLFKSIMSKVGPYTLLDWALRGNTETGEMLFDTIGSEPAEALRKFLDDLNNDR